VLKIFLWSERDWGFNASSKCEGGAYMNGLNPNDGTSRLLKFVCVLSISFILITVFVSGNVYAQGDPEPEESIIQAAKGTLEKMGISLGNNLGKVRNQASTWAFSARVGDTAKALNFGLGLAEPRPTPVKSGAEIFLTVGPKGKVTFYVDSQNKMKNNRNSSTSVLINKDIVLNDIVIQTASFPAVER
jgi:hypothetical protein